ncbi:unnamed protein product [Lactuca virosa]|uniref:Small ribosomal subunit protein uS14m n=1 Tax=Lactuca virosa TaxID=75947 RepID=A0AAU9PA94_9ASTR|nr:unnamed protein product [Lactuca virosa]
MSDKRNIQDQQRRLLAEKYELRRKLYKAFSKDTDLPNDVREKHRCKLADLPRNSSFTRAVNRVNLRNSRSNKCQLVADSVEYSRTGIRLDMLIL